jgi:hypothetical protein
MQGFGYRPAGPGGQGFATGYIGVNWPDHINQGDGTHIAAMEIAMRKYCYETARFWRRSVPGFENSYLLSIAPFLGSRGGPSIEGEVTITMEKVEQGGRFDDVILVYALKPDRPLDLPYRILLPKTVDGLLACGRSAGRRPGSLIRGRGTMMMTGQAAGTAAAITVRTGCTAREVNVQELQRSLFDAGFYLGDRQRLKELEIL